MKKAYSPTKGLGAAAFTTVVLAAIAVSSPDDWLRSKLWILYAVQYASFVRLAIRQKDRWLFILSPSFLTVSYIAINNCLGAYSFHQKMVFKKDYLSYLDWTNLGWVVAFILCANLTVTLPYFWIKRKSLTGGPSKSSSTPRVSLTERILVVSYCGSVIVLFSSIELDLRFFGGTGDFSIVLQTLAALSIVTMLAKSQQRGRYVAYLLMLFGFASFSSFEKRDAIFLLVSMAFIECLMGLQPRSLAKLMATALVIVTTVILLVIMMSIYRGYGQYRPKDFLSTRHYILNYTREPIFYAYLGNNLEYNRAFFHSHQAIEYVCNSPDLLLNGSTFLKILFVPFPREMLPFKPRSIVDHYTNHHSPEIRAIGGSWASTIYSEFFWNFHYAGLLGLLLTYYLATRCYLAIAYRLRRGVDYELLFALYAYQQMLILIRGSGFDAYFAYLIVAAGLAVVVFFPLFVIFRAGGYPLQAGWKGQVGGTRLGKGRYKRPITIEMTHTSDS